MLLKNTIIWHGEKCNTNNNYVVNSPTNALFINLVKSFKFTLKYTIISLLHVPVFNDHHQGALSVPNYSYIYVKTLGKIMSLYKLCDVAACRKAAVRCARPVRTCAPDGHLQSVTIPDAVLYNLTSWWWAQQCSKHVDEHNKLVMKQEFVHRMFIGPCIIVIVE